MTGAGRGLPRGLQRPPARLAGARRLLASPRDGAENSNASALGYSVFWAQVAPLRLVFLTQTRFF